MKQAKIEKRERREDGEEFSDDNSDALDSDEDVDLDGGFRIPSSIWKKLYRCVHKCCLLSRFI